MENEFWKNKEEFSEIFLNSFVKEFKDINEDREGLVNDFRVARVS
jgi:hypothetical protein